MSAVVWTTHTA
jgi:hypothetical protein